MSHFSPTERRKLARVLELLSSDHPGERQAAAEAAHRLVREAGARWEDIILINPQPSQRPTRHPSPRRSPTSGYRYARWRDWRSAAGACWRHRRLLNAWEEDFVANLIRFDRLSDKQDPILRRLADRVSVFLDGGAP